MIRERLAERRIFLTGATGFLGSALLERLVVDLPVARVDVLVRGVAEERLRSLAYGSAFAAARARLGAGVDELFAAKVRCVPGDLSAPVAIDDDVDLIVHCAATVSFDPAIDEAFAVNVDGTLAVHEAARGRPFLHVSTAYVAGNAAGLVREEAPRSIDWRREIDAARGVAADLERASRRGERLDELAAEARKSLGKAGATVVARRTEELRREWLREELVHAGRARARSLGWQDTYTLTKAIAEMALTERASAAGSPLAIVRPSIIESALVHPQPGWIDGFRMADPVMLAYGRGMLPDFPGHPDGYLDIVPVDFVVNAMLAVAATMDEADGVYHLSTGRRNPLRFRDVYAQARRYFVAHPLPEANRGTIAVPSWTFPGRPALEQRLRRGSRLVDWATKVVEHLPAGSFAREAATSLDRRRRGLDFLEHYGELYAPYTETELVFDDERARALLASLPADDRTEFGFDAESFSWPHYFQVIHLPNMTAPLRWPAAPRERKPALPQRAGDGEIVLAVFDVEGTIVDANVVEGYAWLRLAASDDWSAKLGTLGSLLAAAPGLLLAEREDRGAFLRSFYRRYAGLDVAEVRALAKRTAAKLVLQRLAPAAARRLREHRRAGHRVVLLTGAVDFLVEALAPLADVVAAARLEEKDGRFTGQLAEPPLVGEARAAWLRRYAREHGADLGAAFAYGDSLSDLPLLEAVGHAVAVNADTALSRVARQRRWPIVDWPREGGSLVDTVLRPVLG